MPQFSKGDKVAYRPNTKVEPWICEVLETPPIERVINAQKLTRNRYKVRVIEPVEDTVFVKPVHLKSLDYYDKTSQDSFGETER